ncbi:arginine--tRNA ligase [Patescibacteria group bacterium]|nr:arginine--tRNA ligase [Patescibacteria group bacterium]
MTIDQIKENLVDLLKKALLDLPKDFIFELEPPPQPEMGDLCFSCFKIAKHLNQSPDQTASDLAKLFGTKIPLIDLVDKIEAKGPYLNIFLEKNIWFETVCQQVLKQKDKFGHTKTGKGKKILIEYSAPNTNKPQHLGHLRNNFLGWTMANLFSTTGAKVIKANLVNDRGVHICKSMLAYQKWGQGKTPELEKIKGDHFVGQYYVLFEENAKENPELLDEVQEMLKQWEEGNASVMTLWQQMNQWAINGLKQTYEKIGVEFDYWYFESDIYNSGKKIVQKALKKKLCYQREDKAIEIDLTHTNSALRMRPCEYKKENLGKKVLLRPNGTSVYITQDIGLAKLRQDQFEPNKAIYVVGSEQDYSFRVLFKILEIFGFDWVKSSYHLSYGLVFLPKGKMKSREGEIVDADNLINQMEQLAKSETLNRNPSLSPTEVSKRAEIISLAALKFYLLKFTPSQQVNFDPQASISFEGDSGPYIQYTYARIKSILKKFDHKEKTNKIDYSVLGNKEETELFKLLFIFPQILEKSVNTYNPSHLAHHVLRLSQRFNEFYHQHRVLKAEPKLRNGRLKLIQAVAEVIKNSLHLLGIKILEEM